MTTRTRRRGGRPWARLVAQVYAEETHCGIPDCGAYVDQTLPANHDLARSVDHIIPLADGGPEYARWNVRLAHRICNSRRGATHATQPHRSPYRLRDDTG